jgi:AcrR family transcriptional regulator
MSTPGKTRRDATENRAALLAAARLELNADANASLETIAASAGLSRRAVYGHFASRDDLLRELLTGGAARVSAAIERSHDADPVVDLALIAANLWREVESMRVMALFAVRGPFKGITGDNLRALRTRVLNDVDAGQATGSIRADIDAPTLARLVEEGALMVLAEATAQQLSAAEGHALVIRVVLGLVGFGWREANDLVASHPSLTYVQNRVDA